MGFNLPGSMIGRQVRRWFEQRSEPRVAPAVDRALLYWRGKTIQARIGNVSSAGVMLWLEDVPHIGERVSVQLLDQEPVPGQVRWVRDGKIGINLTGPVTAPMTVMTGLHG